MHRQEVTSEPISIAHARRITTIHVGSVLLHRPDNQVQLLSTLDMGTTVPIAIAMKFTHIFVLCDKFIMYTYMCCVGAAMHCSTTHNIN